MLFTALLSLMLCVPVSPIAAQSSASEPRSLSELLAAFREMPGFEARFVEEKTMALLAIPLRSEGQLYFAPPSLLLREVTSPSPQRVLLRKDQVRVSSGPKGAAREELIDLSARSEIRPLVESLLWLLRGDGAALERAFETEFVAATTASAQGEGQREGWTLSLVPRNAALAQLLARIMIRGQGPGADTITIDEASGDRSEMKIFDANPSRQFTPDEMASIFGVSAASVPAPGRHE